MSDDDGDLIPTSDWRAIRAALKQHLQDGRYGDDGRFPTHRELMHAHGATRHAVRRALDALKDEGLIDGRQGAAPRITAGTIELPVSLRTRFSASTERLGLDAESELVAQRRRIVSPQIARMLGLKRIEAVPVAEILRRIGVRPVSFTVHYFAPGLADRLPQLPRLNPRVTLALKEIGITDFVRQSSVIAARLPRPREMAMLGIGRHQPVISVLGQNIALDGAPVEISESVFPGDSVRLAFRSDL